MTLWSIKPLMANTQPTLDLTEIEQEVVSIFGRIVQLLGMPRSLGQIYGLIYISPQPICMDDLVTRLGISLGSASQGLRQLRILKAIRVAYVPGQRRDHFVPETEFRKLLANFVDDQLRPQLEAGQGALAHLDSLIVRESAAAQEHYRSRIDKLRRLHHVAGTIAPAIGKIINF